jgi:hypothetical protein
MRIFFYLISVLIFAFAFMNVNSQNLDKSTLKTAKTIRLYVNDSTKNAAIERFVAFINKTGFVASMPQKSDLKMNTRFNGDTISTNPATLYDFMMGDYQAVLKFYPARDYSDKLYIAVSGYVSNNALGGNFADLKMQKGGKDSNWAQRALFNDLNKHLSGYTGVNNIMYSDE